jgi:hypothetical protein
VDQIMFFVENLRSLIQNGTVDDQILDDLRTAPVTIYFAMFEKMNMSFSATKGHDYSRTGEHSIFSRTGTLQMSRILNSISLCLTRKC